MIDINCYLDGEKVKRSQIALDIKRGVLSKEDVNALISDNRINSAFRGSENKEKKPEEEWNQQYLEELSYAVIAESFNADFLLYLCDVANYVNNGKASIKKKVAIWILLAVVTLIIVIVLIVTNKQK